MLLPDAFARFISPLLIVLLVLTTAPIPTALGAAPDGLIGSVSAAGAVELRGVAVEREGTLFSGDTIRSREGAYVSIALDAGPQIEFTGDTEVRVDADETAVRIAMNEGSLAFSSLASSSPLSIDVQTFEIEAPNGSVGEVAVLGNDEVGVHAVSGSVTVRSSLADDAIVVQEGDARVISFSDAPLAGPAGPEPLPAAPRRQLTDSQWLGVGVFAGAIAVAYGAWRLLRDSSPSNP